MNGLPKIRNPKPGTREASDAGCRCPILDNCHGKGYFGDGEKYGWVVSSSCSLHAQDVREILEQP